jgi:hypothetical protein
MPLDVVRLRDSDFAALSSGDGFRAGLMLHCAAWHQVPAASLPDDDRMLAHLAGLGRDLRSWKGFKQEALRGWIKCSDGRLYHPVIAEKARQSFASKQAQRARTAKATSVRLGLEQKAAKERNDSAAEQRDVARDVARDVERNEQRDVHQGTGTGTGTGTGILDDDELAGAKPSGARIGRTKADFDRIELSCREAAGLSTAPSPRLFDTSPIIGLIDSGLDLEGVILPALRARPNPSASSWNYFVGQIKQYAANLEAAARAPMPASDARPRQAPREEKRNVNFAVAERAIERARSRDRQSLNDHHLEGDYTALD